MLPKVSPNSSLKNGPATPCGRVARMSPIFLRTWYQSLGHVVGVHRVADHEHHLRLARPRVAADEFVVAGLQQLFLDPLGDLPRHLVGGGARPHRAHHHDLEGEGRIFRLAQLGVRPDPEHGQQEHEVPHQRAVAQGPFGDVEPGHVCIARVIRPALPFPSPPGRGAGVRVRGLRDGVGGAEPSSGAARHPGSGPGQALLPGGEGKCARHVHRQW